MKDYISQIENMIQELRNKLAKKDFYTASLYIKLDKLKSANIYYYSIVNNYYDTRFVNDALFNIALLNIIEGNNPVLFLKNHKNSFLSNEDYLNTLLLIEDLDINHDEDYYINLLK